MALIRHGLFKTSQLQINLTQCYLYATKAEKKRGIDRKLCPKINSTFQSLAARGFLRPLKSYQPPKDVNEKLTKIFKSIIQTTDSNRKLIDLNERYQLFTECEKEFKHFIPNSQLHLIQTLKDVENFYNTSIDTLTPLDKLRSEKLPENLHIQFDYVRFHPDTDTKFRGQTAFNRSSTIVSGLKYKDKYKGHKQNEEWPFNS